MILTDRIKMTACTEKPPEGALEKVHDHYEALEGEPESVGTIVQYWAVGETHFFVVMIDGRIDCLRLFTLSDLPPKQVWHLSVDSQTKFTDDPVDDPSGKDFHNRLERGS